MRGTRSLLTRAHESLRAWASRVPRAASVLLGVARERVGRQALAVRPGVGRMMVHENERLAVRERRLALVHPGRVLQRGYSILRLGDGRVVTGPELAPAGSEVRAELKRGILRLRSEGGR